MAFGCHVDFRHNQTPQPRLQAVSTPDSNTMPTPTIRTVMLEELREHHLTTQQQRFRERVAAALSDVSSSGTSDSMSVVSESDADSVMSIDTPDIQISSDGILDPSSSTSSSSDTDSLDSISDFEINYYINWVRRYRELLNLIEKTRVLYPAPPIPKCSQLHLLDHWRAHSPEHFCRKTLG